jgi:hypothetical protein
MGSSLFENIPEYVFIPGTAANEFYMFVACHAQACLFGTTWSTSNPNPEWDKFMKEYLS